MGFNRLYKHKAPHRVFVSADSDGARTPHRFILQYVKRQQWTTPHAQRNSNRKLAVRKDTK